MTTPIEDVRAALDAAAADGGLLDGVTVLRHRLGTSERWGPRSVAVHFAGVLINGGIAQPRLAVSLAVRGDRDDPEAELTALAGASLSVLEATPDTAFVPGEAVTTDDAPDDGFLTATVAVVHVQYLRG